MPRHPFICWIFGFALLTGCTQNARTQALTAPTAQTQAIMAQQYLDKAEDAVLRGDSQTAYQYLQPLKPTELNPEQRNQFSLLNAQTYLSFGEAERALQFLIPLMPTQLTAAKQRIYFQSLAFAYGLTGQVFESVTARTQLEPLLDDDKQREKNQRAILDALLSLPDHRLLDQQHGGSNSLTGWLALARLIKQQSEHGIDIQTGLQRWQQNNPAHPANEQVLQAYLKPQSPAPSPNTAPASPAPSPVVATATPPLAATAIDPAKVAVLLPESGNFAAAGLAIKQGILAAHQANTPDASQAGPTFYDTQKTDIVPLYRQAVAQGAKWVIGPLIKEELQSLVQSAELSVPLLALNHVENLTHANLYQFGLSPLDDAAAIARLAWQKGHRQVLILTAQGAQGQRMGDYLSAAWQKAGGKVVEVVQYDGKQRDFSAWVKSTLKISGQHAQPRTDVDAVLLNAPSDVARVLYPHLNYYASELPIYAVPQVYSGVPNDFQDADLNNIRFCDAPWLLAKDDNSPLSRQSLRKTWQALPASQLRLFAMGLDAYQLLNQLPHLRATPLSGVTGTLTLADDNRISRQLLCAQFQKGVPVLEAP